MEYLFNQYEYIIDDSNNQYQLQLLLHDSIAQGLGRKASAPHHTHTHTHTHTHEVYTTVQRVARAHPRLSLE